jgi:hypothetical protein
VSDTYDIAERLRAWSPLIASGYEVPAAAAVMDAAAVEIERLGAEVAKSNAERDEAQLQLQRIRCEISCRVEHGADSNGHLEAILAMLKKEAKP